MLFYWEQSKHFFDASKTLPDLAAPLTTYYCFLNATKALLSAKDQVFAENHGVGGRAELGRKSLANEVVDFQGAGVLPALCSYLIEPNNAGTAFTLQDLFWQMPFIHRAYCLSYRSATELFIPLTGNCFMRRDGSREAWFQAEIDRRCVNAHTERLIQPGFELFEEGSKHFIRRKRRFRWSGRDIESSIVDFKKYHKTIRRRVVPIYSSENRWYLKKSVVDHSKLVNAQLVLIYACNASPQRTKPV